MATYTINVNLRLDAVGDKDCEHGEICFVLSRRYLGSVHWTLRYFGQSMEKAVI